MNHQAFVDFFFDPFFVQIVKETRLPLKAGAKIVCGIPPPSLFLSFFGLFFEEKA